MKWPLVGKLATMETRINVYSGGDIVFSIGVDTNSNQPIPAAGDTVVHGDHEYRVSDRKFYYGRTSTINLICEVAPAKTTRKYEGIHQIVDSHKGR
jgi:hypothetical protein